MPHLELQLAQACARGATPHHNYGITTRRDTLRATSWSASFAGDIEAQERMLREACAKRADRALRVCQRGFLKQPRDVDDAFHIESTAGGYLLRKLGFKARPQLAWNLACPLGQRRGSTRHQRLLAHKGDKPHASRKAGHCRLFSLSANDTRPAFVLELELRKDGTVLS